MESFPSELNNKYLKNKHDILQESDKFSRNHLQYRAKRMQTKFIEILLLFPRNIIEISSKEP